MRKLIVTQWMSLDGVVQAPGAADEDTTWRDSRDLRSSRELITGEGGDQSGCDRGCRRPNTK